MTDLQTLLILLGLVLAGFISWVAAGFWLGIKTAGGVPASWSVWLNPGQVPREAEFARFIWRHAGRTALIAAPVIIGEQIGSWWAVHSGWTVPRINWAAVVAVVGMVAFWGGLFMAVVGS